MWSREGEGEEKLSHWESFPIVLFTGRPLPKDSERRSDIIFIHVSSTTKTSLGRIYGLLCKAAVI